MRLIRLAWNFARLASTFCARRGSHLFFGTVSGSKWRPLCLVLPPLPEETAIPAWFNSSSSLNFAESKSLECPWIRLAILHIATVLPEENETSNTVDTLSQFCKPVAQTPPSRYWQSAFPIFKVCGILAYELEMKLDTPFGDNDSIHSFHFISETIWILSSMKLPSIDLIRC